MSRPFWRWTRRWPSSPGRTATKRSAAWATRFGSRSSASATAPRRWCRASASTATPMSRRIVPGLMHVNLGGYHVRDIEFTAAFDIDDEQGRQGPVRGDLRRAEQHLSSSPTCRTWACRCERGMTHDGLGKYLSRGHQKAPGPTADIVKHPQGHPDRRGRQLPAGRLRDGDQVVRRADPRGRLRLRQLHPGLHRPRGLLAATLRGARPADHRRRHQEPGRRDDHPPRAGQPVPRARRAARPHLPAQLRRQHRLPQHARARAAGVARRSPRPTPSPASSTTSCRPTTSTSAQRLRALAGRPQVVPTSAWRARPSATCRSTSS